MHLTNYAFMVIGPGLTPEANTIKTSSPLFKATVVGVETVDQACDAAKELVNNGVQMIELCGGFDGQAVQRVIDAIDGQVPVGAAAYSEAEQAKVDDFFAK
ncbi:hypothetical protein DSLASN_32000 [Desulfoluna limicola]|uniref:Uncharacterized protein n=1 Tax=Desulfoluna limicola TaxID=2810562 RepID=A0ABM7PJ26_9BACT|nr:DUF6506 family protein [Desulfoluna limicola]BCS97568.1 hypothetical protein DSLASN_32000 [Desulfoluna limicola]